MCVGEGILCVYIYIYIYIFIYMRLCICACVFTCICRWVCGREIENVCMGLCVCACERVIVCVCVCVWGGRVSLSLSLCICARVCVSESVRVCVFCIRVYYWVYESVSVFVSMFVSVCICACVCASRLPGDVLRSITSITREPINKTCLKRPPMVVHRSVVIKGGLRRQIVFWICKGINLRGRRSVIRTNFILYIFLKNIDYNQ